MEEGVDNMINYIITTIGAIFAFTIVIHDWILTPIERVNKEEFDKCNKLSFSILLGTVIGIIITTLIFFF